MLKEYGSKERKLFLVPELNNSYDINAVMLSNGERKLGYVSASEAPILRKIFERWRNEKNFDEVIVVEPIYNPCAVVYDDDYCLLAETRRFKDLRSIKFRAVHRINERLARKFASEEKGA